MTRTTIFAFLYSVGLIAQAPEPTAGFKNEFDLSILSPANYVSPHIAVGFYRFIRPDLQIGLDAGFGHKSFSGFDYAKGFVGEDYHYFTIKPEIRYHLDQEGTVHHFVGVEAFYMDLRDRYVDSHYYSGDQTYEFEEAGYTRIKYGVNFIVAWKFKLNDRLAIIQENGIGYRYRTIDFHGVKGEFLSDKDPLFALSNFKREGSNFSVNLFFDLKLTCDF